MIEDLVIQSSRSTEVQFGFSQDLKEEPP